MSVFTVIILILFVSVLAFQFISALDRDHIGLAVVFALEILMFVYLAKILV